MKRFYLGLALALVALVPVASFAATTPPITVYGIQLDTGTKTAAATSGAATLSKAAGVITSEALTTAAAATYTLTLTNTTVAAADQCFVSLANGTNSAGTPTVQSVTPASGSMVVVVRNAHASAAFNGTLKVAFFCLRN